MKKKILIVEDSLLIAKALNIILSQAGYDTKHTVDGRKVIEIVKKDKTDLVMLDLMMPEMTGAEVFSALKKDPETKKTKVIILTAKTDALKWDKTLKNCDKFITKPFDNNEVIEEVKKILK